MADGHSAAEALNSGFHLAYLIGAALIGVAIVIALRAFRSEEPAASKAGVAPGGCAEAAA